MGSWEFKALTFLFAFQFGRWSFLAVGVAYGAYHQSRLSKKADKDRKIEAEKKVIRDAQIAIEKKRAADRKSWLKSFFEAYV